jgi:organic radical activating enzyme
MAKIVEIFSSIQGEGLYVSQKQVFIRFAGCNLRCDYCDEFESWREKNFKEWSLTETLEKVDELVIRDKIENVSLTGGEPLLSIDFIREMIPFLKLRRLKIHLETNATLVSAFKTISGSIDVIAADIKLPSSTKITTWNLHKQFLAILPDKTFVKIVLTSETEWTEIEKMVEIIAGISRDIPVFLQPVTERFSMLSGKKVIRPTEEFLKKSYEYCVLKLKDVEILPQQHPVWKIK